MVTKDELLTYKEDIEDCITELGSCLVDIESAFFKNRLEEEIVLHNSNIKVYVNIMKNAAWYSPFNLIYPLTLIINELWLKISTEDDETKFTSIIDNIFEGMDLIKNHMYHVTIDSDLNIQKRMTRKCSKYAKRSLKMIEKFGGYDLVNLKRIDEIFNSGVLFFNTGTDLLDNAREPLLSMGFKVYYSMEGEQALKLVKRHKPFLMLLDFRTEYDISFEFLKNIEEERYHGGMLLVSDLMTFNGLKNKTTINFERNFKPPINFYEVIDDILQLKEIHDKNIFGRV